MGDLLSYWLLKFSEFGMSSEHTHTDREIEKAKNRANKDCMQRYEQ